MALFALRMTNRQIHKYKATELSYVISYIKLSNLMNTQALTTA